VMVDITDRKRAEQERERLHQLEADFARINRVTTLGELTASLAHEINQPIGAAAANASACVRWLSASTPNIEEARSAARRIVNDANRAAEIIQRIRLLFKKGAPRQEPVDINEVMTEIVALARAEASRCGVSIRRDLARGLPPVHGDRVQLQQVVMNLVMNGIDAMKGVDGSRELTLTSRLDGDDRVTVSVGDTGIGLPPESERIFDAFFTTKPHGTGMGLAISRTIVESHGGRLSASSNSGRGAVFQFTLPTIASGVRRQTGQG
jgi:signal transduction histidine kinase